MPPARRYPILLAFLSQALHHHTDVAVELYDQCLWEYHGAAKKELKEWRQSLARSTNDTLRLFRALGQVLLDPEIADAAVRAESFARVPAPVLRAAIEETQGLIRPRHDDAIDFFGTRYSTIRQFAPPLQTLTFHAQGPNDTVLRAWRSSDPGSCPDALSDPARCDYGPGHGHVAAVHARARRRH